MCVAECMVEVDRVVVVDWVAECMVVADCVGGLQIIYTGSASGVICEFDLNQRSWEELEDSHDIDGDGEPN